MSDKEMLDYAKAYRALIKATAEISNNSEDQKRFEIIDWLVKQAEKTQNYREALKFYADEKSWMNREVTILMDGEPTDVEDCPAIFDDGGNIARKALEG